MDNLYLRDYNAPPQSRGTIAAIGGIFLFAVLAGFVFNLFMPQGVGFLPAEVSTPLWKPVSLAEARNLWDEKAVFVDARDPGDYKAGHLKRAVNLNPEEYKVLYPLLKEQLLDASVVVVYGRTRSRFPAAWVAQRLKREGVKKVMVMEEGLKAWLEAGHPMSRSRRRPQS